MFLQLKTKNKNCAAFTLVEVICVIVLIGVLASIPLAMFTNSVKSHVGADSNYSQIQNVQMAVTRIILELQNATNVTTVTDGINYDYGTENRSILLKSDTDGTGKIVLVITTSPTLFHPLVKNLVLASSSLSYSSAQSILTVTIASNFSGGAQKTFTTQIYKPL